MALEYWKYGLVHNSKLWSIFPICSSPGSQGTPLPVQTHSTNAAGLLEAEPEEKDEDSLGLGALTTWEQTTLHRAVDQFVSQGLTLDETVALACPGGESGDQAVGDACWGLEDEDMTAEETLKHNFFSSL